MVKAFSTTCPRHISPELWAGMSADAQYQAQQDARAAAQRIGWLQWALLAPPLLFMALPPVQTLVNQYLPPSHYVRLNGTVDPRQYLDESVPGVGDVISGYEVTSAFGPRVHPITFELSNHKGIDLATPTGTPLYAPAVDAEQVTVRCWFDAAGGGNVAEISSESIPAYRFKALHLATCIDGQFTAGEVFATTGATGMGTGEHLDLRQLNKTSDAPMPPMTGYVDWLLSGSAGPTVIDIPALKAAIISQESGGQYDAVNPDSGALGLGQVMPENLAGEGQGWDYEALGRDVSPTEFLTNPTLQHLIMEHQLSEIALSQRTDSTGAQRDPVEIAKRSAAVWYSGRSDYCSSTSVEIFGAGIYPSGTDYCDSVAEKFEQLRQPRG